MKGISILLALIIGTFSHTDYFNRAANTAERAIRKMSGVVLVGRIILGSAESLISGTGPEEKMPEEPESIDEETIAADTSGEETGESAADETAESRVSPEAEDAALDDREAAESADDASEERDTSRLTAENGPDAETEETKEPGIAGKTEIQAAESGEDGEAKTENEEAEPEISIEIILNPDEPDADAAFGNGGKDPLVFEFEDPDAKERKEQLPDC